MAKMQSVAALMGLREIPLSQIVDNGNVRTDYREIEELAESIKNIGQLEPVLVKPLEKDSDGITSYELIAGHRRRRAIQYLYDRGESFTTIKALIVMGDKLTLQLIENLQRSDLTARERESGIYAMCKNGLSQKEVAARLAKPEVFVSRNVSTFKVREAAGAEAKETGGLSDPLGHDLPAGESDEPSSEKPPQKLEIKKPVVPTERWIEEFDPPHKQMDFNDICVAVFDYGKKLETEIAACEKFNWKNGNENDEGCECADHCGIYYKHEAVEDIIALLHSRL